MTQPLTDAITALTRYANETTGASDTTLSDAVRTLCDGYGGGGGFTVDEIALKQINGDIVLTTTTVATGAFENTGITSVYSESVTSLNPKSSCFKNCKQLRFASFPNLVDAWGSNSIFEGCSALTSVNFPKLKWMHTNFLRDCTSFELGVFPAITGLNAWCFRGDTKLHTLDFGELNDIQNYDMFTSSKLSTLIIRTDSVCKLQQTSSFNSTPFASGGTGGKLYVPQALISSYESATNWSTILGYANNQILPIEGSIYETQYADGTPIE